MKILDYISSDIILDEAQLSILKELENIRISLSKPKIFKIIKNIKYKGIYLYGDVGRGKTILAKAFFQSLKQNKIFYQYQEFLKNLHEENHALFLNGEKSPIEKIARKLSSLYQVICIDELEIRDITDAMLMQNLCIALANLGVFIFFTSNIKPLNLYKDGIQRESFLKFINFVQESYFVSKLESEKDYRFSKLYENKNIIIYPDSSENLNHYKEIVKAIIRNKTLKQDSLKVFGRNLSFNRVYGDEVLLITFQELFVSELSYNDYVEICRKFSIIILDEIFSVFESSDEIIRFINFIDNAYSNKVILIAYLKISPKELIGKNNKYQKEFQRTISRIAEMNSEYYIGASKYYQNK